MLSSIISRLIILMFGILYPAYASYKAVKTKNEKEYVKWMMYWIVFALFTCLETIADIFISFWFPFYYELKILFVLWLMSPATKGSSLLYKKFVHPAFIRKEKEIDEYINRAKEQGYSTVLQMGSRGLNYATGVVVQTALRGQFSLVNHLRKSHSLTDISPSSNYAQLKSPELVETDADDQTETEFQPSKAISRPKRQLRVVKSKSSPEKFSEEDETTSVDQDDDDDDVDYIVQRKIKRPAQRRNTANLPMTSEKSKSLEYAEGEDFSDDTIQSKSKLLRSKSLQTSKKYSSHSEVGAYATMPRTRHKGTGKKRPPLNIH